MVEEGCPLIGTNDRNRLGLTDGTCLSYTPKKKKGGDFLHYTLTACCSAGNSLSLIVTEPVLFPKKPEINN